MNGKELVGRHTGCERPSCNFGPLPALESIVVEKDSLATSFSELRLRDSARLHSDLSIDTMHINLVYLCILILVLFFKTVYFV